MSTFATPTARSGREARAKARQSRRPSRLGAPAGAAAGPDRIMSGDAGFPGLLKQVWKEASAARDLAAAMDTLLTLSGHVPADIQLRALSLAEESALRALCGISWRDKGTLRLPPDDPGGTTAFLGELGLTTTGKVLLSVPSQGALEGQADLVDGVMRVPWSAQAVARYRDNMRIATARYSQSVADCRAWLAAARAPERDSILSLLTDAARRTAPFILYQENKRYTNFRERNNLTGKTLLPGHPDCALSSLRNVPLELWSDSDAVTVVCLTLLVRSVGYARVEEANGTQLSVDHVADLLERTRRTYNSIPGGRAVAPAASTRITALDGLAAALCERRKEIAGSALLYREIHGPLMHKIERIAAPPHAAATRREDELCARLRARLPVTGGTLTELAASLAASHQWLAAPHGGFGTGLESLVRETVSAAVTAFDADFAMSRGMRSLCDLIEALRREDWAQITKWDIQAFFCCVLPDPRARRYFGNSSMQLADVAWSMSARMQYNSWHFLAGNLPAVPEVASRDYFVPPTIPDIAYYSDQHHHGHVAARVRFSIRSPQPVRILGQLFRGFVDLRLLRCDGSPFSEQDLLCAHRASAFIATATTLLASLAADGIRADVEAFDPGWHQQVIANPPSPFPAALRVIRQ